MPMVMWCLHGGSGDNGNQDLWGSTERGSGAKADGITAIHNGGGRSFRHRSSPSPSMPVIVIIHEAVGASSTLVVAVAAVVAPSTLVVLVATLSMLVVVVIIATAGVVASMQVVGVVAVLLTQVVGAVVMVTLLTQVVGMVVVAASLMQVVTHVGSCCRWCIVQGVVVVDCVVHAGSGGRRCHCRCWWYGWWWPGSSTLEVTSSRWWPLSLLMLAVQVVVAWIIDAGGHVVQVMASVIVDAGGMGGGGLIVDVGGGLDRRCWRSRYPGGGLHHC